MVDQHVFVCLADIPDMLRGVVANFWYFLIGMSFAISKVKHLTVTWIDNVIFNSSTHVASSVWHSKPPNKKCRHSPLLRIEWRLNYFGGSIISDGCKTPSRYRNPDMTNGSQELSRHSLSVYMVTVSFFLNPLSVMVLRQCDVGKSIFCAEYPPQSSQLVALTTLNGFMLTLLFRRSMWIFPGCVV